MAAHGMVMRAVNYYAQDGEVDQTTCANCGGIMSHDIIVSKMSRANAMVGQGDLLMMVPVARSCHVPMVSPN